LLQTKSKDTQLNLFHSPLSQMLDITDLLIALSDTINWNLENLSDENIILQWKRNPYYQYFCGLDELQIIEPCHCTELVKFRNRIGTEGMKVIFTMSVSLHGKQVNEKQVIVDTTVQENNITYPTDGKLAIKIINHLHKTAKNEKIQLRRTYMKEIKGHRINLRFFKHPKKEKKLKLQ
jgi:IS5 family transposase